MAKQTVTVYINAERSLFLEETPVDIEMLEAGLMLRLENEMEGSVVLRADQTVPVQNVVSVIDVVNKINSLHQTRHKVILATQPLK